MDSSGGSQKPVSFAVAPNREGPQGHQRVFCRCDVRRDEDLGRLVGCASDIFGGLDGIVNNAVSYLDHGITSSRADWHEAFDVTLFGGAVLLAEALPLLTQSASASVVNVASIAAKVAQRNRALYPTAKAAIMHLTRLQAVQLAERLAVQSVPFCPRRKSCPPDICVSCFNYVNGKEEINASDICKVLSVLPCLCTSTLQPLLPPFPPDKVTHMERSIKETK